MEPLEPPLDPPLHQVYNVASILLDAIANAILTF